MKSSIERILARVQKPARYTRGEYNQIRKDRASVNIRMALCFPDTYEIGMSNLGIEILYGAANARPDICCERVFAPWGDMEEEMLTFRRSISPMSGKLPALCSIWMQQI